MLRLSPVFFLLLSACNEPTGQPLQDAFEGEFCFKRHVIDDTGAGADGVHLADINRDGYPDVVSGWEESAELKVYLHPGATVDKGTDNWASVEISGGQSVASIEDAAFADLDGDGNPDAVISATEGEGDYRNRRIRLHRWHQSKPITQADSWSGSVIYRDEPSDRFMKVRAAQLDGANGADIVAASRDLFEDEDQPQLITSDGGIYLYRSPPLGEMGDTRAWRRQRLATVHKGKSIELIDMDSDRDIDILYSGARKIFWLENPGHSEPDKQWISHRVGTGSDLTLCDMNGDGIRDIVATASSKEYPMMARWFERTPHGNKDLSRWPENIITLGTPLPRRFYQMDNSALKSIACGQFRADAKPGDPPQLAITNSGSGFGIFLLTAPATFRQDGSAPWTGLPLTDYQWIMKYDNVITVDMNNDGLLDLLTSEENEGWFLQGAGVLWYENGKCL